jgi:NLR family CARD domain-containing protein 3
MGCHPRDLKNLGPREKIKTPWIFNLSVFKSYKPDTPDILNQCFEVDWAYIEKKVRYLIKDDEDREKVKKYMKHNYKQLRDAYKLTAGQDAAGNNMSIGKYMFGALMQNCGDLVDGKTLKIADLDLAMIAVKAADSKIKNKNVPADQLVRYNFLEIQIRLAEQKYIKSGLFKKFSEAVPTMLDSYMLPLFAKTDSHIWRKNTLWTE